MRISKTLIRFSNRHDSLRERIISSKSHEPEDATLKNSCRPAALPAPALGVARFAVSFPGESI